MKKLLSVVFGLIFSGLVMAGNVWNEEQISNNGFLFVRIVNNTYQNMGCTIEDQYQGYHRFIVYANSSSIWYPVSGPYRWRCG